MLQLDLATGSKTVGTSVNWPEQEGWDAFIRQQREEIGRMVTLHLDGHLSADALHVAMNEKLTQAHAQAAALGRARAGLPGGVTAADMRMAQFIMQEEAEFLEGLIYDLRRKRRYVDPVTGEVARDIIIARAQSYTGRCLGTANETFVASSPDEVLFYWRMSAIEHCYLCPEIAAASPYRRDELPCVPRNNATPCLFNCKCYLERMDGITGFRPEGFGGV